jgi:hypothetical protein
MAMKTPTPLEEYIATLRQEKIEMDAEKSDIAPSISAGMALSLRIAERLLPKEKELKEFVLQELIDILKEDQEILPSHDTFKNIQGVPAGMYRAQQIAEIQLNKQQELKLAAKINNSEKMESIETKYQDIDYLIQQKQINDILVENQVFKNELLFNYVLSRHTESNAPDEISIKQALLQCGVKDFAVEFCKEHLDVLKDSLKSASNQEFLSVIDKDKQYSIELDAQGNLEIIEKEANRSNNIGSEIDKNRKNLGLINGGFMANFLHNWKVSTKLAALYLEKLTLPYQSSNIVHQTEIKMDDVVRYANELEKKLSSTKDRQFEIKPEDLATLLNLGVDYKSIDDQDWIKLSKAEVAGPVEMKLGNSSSMVMLMIKDDKIGCYHLNQVSKQQIADLSYAQNESKDVNLSKVDIRQTIGNYLFNALGIYTVGFSNEDFDLLKNGQLSSTLLRSSQNLFGSDEEPNHFGKVRLIFDENNQVKAHELVALKEDLLIPDNFKGLQLSSEQKLELAANFQLSSRINLTYEGKQNVPGFVTVDPSLNQLVFLPIDKISISSRINGNEISDFAKKELLEGKKVAFYDFRHQGEDMNVFLQIDKRTGLIEIEKMSDLISKLEMINENKRSLGKQEVKMLEIPSSYMGYEFSKKDLQSLNEIQQLKDSVMVEKDGELINGFISINSATNELAFLPKSDILIDKSVLGVNELSNEQKQALVNGYPVFYADFKQEGEKSNVRIEINRVDGSTKISPVISGKKLLEENMAKAAEQKKQKPDKKESLESKVALNI